MNFCLQHPDSRFSCAMRVWTNFFWLVMAVISICQIKISQASSKTITYFKDTQTHQRGAGSDTFKVASVYKSIQIDENFNLVSDVESCFVNIVACGYQVIGSRYTNASKRRAYILSFTSEPNHSHATFSYVILYCNHF